MESEGDDETSDGGAPFCTGWGPMARRTTLDVCHYWTDPLIAAPDWDWGNWGIVIGLGSLVVDKN